MTSRYELPKTKEAFSQENQRLEELRTNKLGLTYSECDYINSLKHGHVWNDITFLDKEDIIKKSVSDYVMNELCEMPLDAKIYISLKKNGSFDNIKIEVICLDDNVSIRPDSQILIYKSKEKYLRRIFHEELNLFVCDVKGAIKFCRETKNWIR